MDALRERHAAAVAAFDARVAAVPPDGWSRPTPCPDWTVRDLVAHLVDEQRWAPALLAGVPLPDAAPVGDPGDDPAEAWRRASREALAAAAAADPEREVELSYGRAPASHYLAKMTMDLVVHGWDLARALGLDEGADPDLVAAVLAWVRPRVAEWEDSGLFDPPLPVPPDADDLTRLLALTGRRR